jgi:hypothetical protein
MAISTIKERDGKSTNRGVPQLVDDCVHCYGVDTVAKEWLTVSILFWQNRYNDSFIPA